MEVVPNINSQTNSTQPKSITSEIRFEPASNASPPALPSTQSGTSASAAGGKASFVFHIISNRQFLARGLLEEEEGGGGVNVDETGQ